MWERGKIVWALETGRINGGQMNTKVRKISQRTARSSIQTTEWGKKIRNRIADVWRGVNL